MAVLRMTRGAVGIGTLPTLLIPGRHTIVGIMSVIMIGIAPPCAAAAPSTIVADALVAGWVTIGARLLAAALPTVVSPFRVPSDRSVGSGAHRRGDNNGCTFYLRVCIDDIIVVSAHVFQHL